jgi:ABC-2 type transport system permease protein
VSPETPKPPAQPLSALAFIVVCSVRNMVRRQIRRLREPRYLVATLFGVLYLFSIFGRSGATRSATRALGVHLGSPLTTSVLAWPGMAVILLGWLFGGDEGGLTFTETEIQLLFPAPLSRRQLVHYKLARTLLLTLFSALILTVTLGRRIAPSAPFFLLGAWLGVGTLSLHLAAASLTRLSLLDHGVRGPARRALALVVPGALVAAVVAGVVQAPDPWPQRWAEVSPYFAHLLASAPLTWASLPLAPAVHVAMAGTVGALSLWLPAALGMLGLHYVWALSTDAAFEEASIASAERRARRIEGMRRGQLSIRVNARPPFKLSAVGHPAVAIYWKNLTAAVRLFSVRLLLVVLLPAIVGGTTAVTLGTHVSRELAAILLAILALSTALFGVQVYRMDFRLDLVNADLLKSLPLRGVDLALAEVLAPFTVLTLVEWAFLLAAALAAPEGVLPWFGRAPVAVAAMIALPALTVSGLIVQNAAAILFPAWIESGAAPPRGVEAIGQRLVTLVGTLVTILVALVPAAAVGGIVGALFCGLIGDAALPLAAMAGAVVVAAEAAFAFFGLGRAFDRFDPDRAKGT